jgi:hypothetical protein
MSREVKRVRFRVLWEAGVYRMIRYLIVYGGGDGTYEAPYYTRPEMCWEVQQQEEIEVKGFNYGTRQWESQPSRLEWRTLWDAKQLTGGYPRNPYLYADKDTRRKITIDMAQKGRKWLDRHLQLLEADPWVIRGDSVDGQGNPCPLLLGDGRCQVIKWFGDGYSSGSDSPPCPGDCNAPRYQSTFPYSYDKFGNDLKYYRDILRHRKEGSRFPF